jgi:multiple antibiotic resistance protein
MIEKVLDATLSLFAVINPIGSIPLFVQLTANMEKEKRTRTLKTAVITGLAISVVFALVGKWIFTKFFQLEIWDIMIAGGCLLLLIAMDHLVFGFLERRVLEPSNPDQIGAVPIACPILIGPGALVTLILNTERFGLTVTLVSVLILFILISIIFLFLNRLCKLMGQVGSIVISKLFLIFLAGIGIRFLFQGILGYLGK